MTAVINFVKGIGDGLMAIVDFVSGLIEDILYMVKLTAEFVANIPEYLSFLPPSVIAMIVSIFAVVVIYKILGRE